MHQLHLTILIVHTTHPPTRSVGLTTSDLRGLLDSMCSDGRVSYTNELYSLNVGRQHTPVGSRAPDSAPANDSQPESKPGGGGSDSPAQGMSVVVIRGGVGADTPGAPAGANTPAPGASSSTPGAIAAPGASPAGASAAPLSKSERMRQVALRTNALKRLEKDFAAGKMSTSDFADQASAIEAEVGPRGWGVSRACELQDCRTDNVQAKTACLPQWHVAV
jgi:hypothetical protein